MLTASVRGLASCVALLLVFMQVAPCAAGTTGALTGRVSDAVTGAPIAGAIVSVVSPSQSATDQSDAAGAYRFLSLSPDTYTLSVAKQGYDASSTGGLTVLADQTQTLTFTLTKSLTTIGRVRSRPANDFVKPGTTSDVYSVNAAGMEAAAGLGGAGGFNQTYGAIASVPGTNVGAGQQGWFQTVSIRGGDIDQVGYELDGIPVNRSYDNAPQTMLSSLGQQELQVYTGGTPATADASGIAGYINQVIKTGTYPGFANLNASVGAPAFYHRLSFEIGGASENRLFTYYLGLSGANQDYRYLNQFNGAGNPLFFYPVSIPSNNGFVFDGSGTPVFAAGNAYGIASTQQRDTVANFHIGIPHHKDGGRDDVQLLYVTSQVGLQYYSSVNDLGGRAAVTGGTPASYSDGMVYTGQVFAPYNPAAAVPYYFPSSPRSRPLGGAFSDNLRDGNDNGVSIVKLQYQRNFNSASYMRLYGYTLYSNWYINGPLSANLPYGAELADYEIPNHTYGLNLSYTNQLNDKNILTLSGSYTTSKLQRYTTTGGFPGSSANAPITNLVDGTGNCYDPVSGQIGSCFNATSRGTFANPTPAISAPGGSPALTSGARWLVTENGYRANLNNVLPTFSAASITDQWRPNDKLQFNLGLRVENYRYQLGETAGGYPARAFWFAAYNRENCFGPALAAPVQRAPGATCPAGSTPVALVNDSGGQLSSTVFQPRLGFTYARSPDSVFRGSFGIYARAENSSWIQYNTAQQDLASFLGSQFLRYGYASPRHDIRPDTSYNYDFSWEQHVKGTNLSFKVTPFYRSTKDQLQNFNISALTGLFSGLNVGRQTSSGVEFAVRKGDFAAPGLSAQLAYTYTRSRIQYGNFVNGSNVIDNLNSYIQQFNSYTSACTSGNATLCGANAGNAQASFNNSGTIVANPYYNMTPQPLLDRNGRYTTYDIIPGPFAGANGYETPSVASLIVNYRANRLTVTPSVTYNSGASYGSPLVMPGYYPQGCSGVTSGTSADPKTCTGSNAAGLPYIFVPDPYTGRFDNLGDFKQPSRFTANLALGYEASSKVKLSLTLTGLVDQCYQRGYKWDNKNTCVYSSLPSSILAPAGNFAPNAPIQLAYPYGYWLNNGNTGFVGTTIPIQAAFNVQLKF